MALGTRMLTLLEVHGNRGNGKECEYLMGGGSGGGEWRGSVDGGGRGRLAWSPGKSWNEAF